MDEDQAATTLANAFREREGLDPLPFEAPQVPAAEPVAEQVEQPDPPAAESTPPEAPAAAESAEEFIPRADLDSLLEGVTDPVAREKIETAYKSFQGGFTKKTQALAEQAKQFEGLDPQAARDAVEFIEALQTDGDFALQVHQVLAAELEKAGLTPAQAAAAATEQVEAAQADPRWEAAGIDPNNPIVKEVEELRQWRTREEQARAREAEERRVDAIVANIERQADMIRRNDPKLTDEDMDVIYKLGASTGGDLMEAEKIFRGFADRVATRYMETKQEQPAAPPAGGGGHSQEAPKDLSLDEGHEVAVERLQKLLSQ